MGPSLSIRFRSLLLRAHLSTFIFYWFVVAGVTAHFQRSLSSRIVVSLAAGLTILLILALHEAARIRVYGWNGVRVRGLDLFLIGASPRLTERSNLPRTEISAGLAGLACISVLAAGFFTTRQRLSVSSPLHGYFSVTSLAFAGVACIHILPALPLDGGRLFRALVWHLSDDPVRGSRGAAVYGHIISAAIIGGGAILLIQPGMWPYWGLALLVTGLQLVAVTAASVRDSFCQQQGQSLPLSSLVIPWSRRVIASSTIDAAIEGLILEADGPPLLVVNDAGDPIGMLRSRNLRHTRRSRWGEQRVKEIMTPLADLPEVAEETSVLETILTIEESRAPFAAFRDSHNHIRFVSQNQLVRQLYEVSNPGRTS